MDADVPNNNDISIVLCGEAGQGIQTIEQIFTKLLKASGYNVFATKEYMSRIRGGSNSTSIRVSSRRVASYVQRVDILIPLDKDAIPHMKTRISQDTVIIGEKEKVVTSYNILDIPFSQMATEVGGPIFSNTVAAGTLSGLLSVNLDKAIEQIKQHFKTKSEDIINKNIEALKKGYEIGAQLLESGKVKIPKLDRVENSEDIVIEGATAVALGAIAGGCSFMSAYPMTPGTSVLTLLAGYADKFNIIVEQAEDEIAAINMAIAAWYAGARGMVTTAGGGFALMVEGLSLAGMIEMPVVLHVGQRPAPATGLPTRTEQGDLKFIINAGHGEFPKIVFAPGTLEDGFYLAQKAFNLADKYQIPVFILTDQYYVDSYYTIPTINALSVNNENFVVKTSENYKRYKFTATGISPRGIPGYGNGLVDVDSDEHDEEGHITEDLDLRIRMVDKRLKKIELIKEDIIPPELIGNEDYQVLVIGWGSTCNVIKESLERLGRPDISFLYFKQVFPLYPDLHKFLEKAKKTVIIENNATSQFGQLVREITGIEIQHKILKYNGLPFSVEEVIENLQGI
ncbi:MAG: 2-oxoacid:acceptor oxidoreductase subunit alpha [Candidatus Margulisiibacteriota bacterium]|nr:MAG: 2-oxoacid:acceptor oxidoreductase subunit alpha [Candidatus Margulisiibacteriota bacterium]